MASQGSTLKARLQSIRHLSDAVIVCQDRAYAVHKAIVCLQSPVLNEALQGDNQKKDTAVVTVDLDLDTCERLIEFMYTSDYSTSYVPALEETLGCEIPGQEPPTQSEPELEEEETDGATTTAVDSVDMSATLQRLICHSRMNSAADHYKIPKLMKLSISKCAAELVRAWSAVDFCALLQEAKGSTGDKEFYKMLAKQASVHIIELQELRLLEKDGLIDDIAVYLLQSLLARATVGKENYAKILKIFASSSYHYQ
ncbi:hypothetical protein F5Y18DRAFT_373924 [Xylariaceae sp. FL1019]|nr:hypothetical protein F5Y18DRAFT_373924 [Xylariaceae sp. FL1019]